ncbi:CoA transferase [Flexivirga meconopsidis]|uniref:CoA transferase n=1 Tax=Flexivirga meconopsidis TaxID=2977121 RepID=UPI00223EBD31|nr:CoA transferase [Flexivirga meconopsidis]
MTWPALPLPWPATADVRGPRAWWAGPLDVEGLAVGSVRAAVSAANTVAVARDCPWTGWVARGLVGASFGSISRLRVDGEAVTEWAELSGFFATGDGWVRLHGNYPHHAEVLRRVFGASDRDGVAAAVRERSALDVEEVVRAAGGIAGAVRGPGEWRAHPQYAAAIAGRDLVTVGTATGAVRPLEPSVSLPLSGMRVLDLTRVIAGPTATRFLGALGADVLRVDPPAMPELIAQHLDTGFAGRSTTLDFAIDDQLATARELAGSADVVLSAYRPGALDRFGLDRDSLLVDHPHLVVVELSAWGDTGPWATQRGFDSIVQAVSGIATTYATPDGAPGALAVQALDHATGYLMATSAMRLLSRRPQEGGASARLALARTADWLLHQPALDGPMDADAFDGPDCPLWLDRADSSYGILEHVRPPVFAGDVPLEYPTAPTPYGSDVPEWWQQE